MGLADDHSGALSFAKKMQRDMYEGLAEDIYKAAYMKGEFKLRSGLTSNEYFDKYQFECSPFLLSRVCHGLMHLIAQDDIRCDVIAGLETGGIPIATILSSIIEDEIKTAFIRKKAKDYGTCRIAEGASIKGAICLVVEDVVTTGGQVIASVNDMRKEGAVVNDVVCVIDREQGGKENLLKEGICLHPLYTMAQLKEISARYQ